MFDIRWNAIVPAKRLKDAKTRLGREDLALPFLTDVINALKGSELISSVTVVSADPTICELAEQLDCRVVVEHNREGLLAAIDLGINHLDAMDKENVVVVLGDLPCLLAEHVELFVNQGREHESAFLSDAEGTGSTMWMRTNSLSPTPHFGPRSRAMHRQSSAYEVTHQDLAGARRDVDTLVNLWDAERIGVGMSTQNALHTRSHSPNPDSSSSIVVTLSQTSPVSGVDETGRIHSLEGIDLSPVTRPRVGQRIVITSTGSSSA